MSYFKSKLVLNTRYVEMYNLLIYIIQDYIKYSGIIIIQDYVACCRLIL